MATPRSQDRALSAVFAASALALVVLLAAHPGGHPHTFAEFIDLELQNRAVGHIVHGGAVAVLMLLLAAHVAFARIVSPPTRAATAAVVFFGAGCVLLTGSLVLDGFVVPALARLFQAASETPSQPGIRSMIQFAGTVIGILMPMSVGAFGASAMAWAQPLMSLGGRARRAGLAVGAIGLGSVLLVAAVPDGARDHALLASLVLLALWQAGFVVALSDTARAPPSPRT